MIENRKIGVESYYDVNSSIFMKGGSLLGLRRQTSLQKKTPKLRKVSPIKQNLKSDYQFDLNS